MSSYTDPRRCPFANLEFCHHNCVFFDEDTERCNLAGDLRDISSSLAVIEDTLLNIEDSIPKPLRKHIRD